MVQTYESCMLIVDVYDGINAMSSISLIQLRDYNDQAYTYIL